MYQMSIQRLTITNAKAAQRIQGVYDKYQKAGGKLTVELIENLEYYDL